MGFLSKIGSAISSSATGMFNNISSSSSNVIKGLTGQIKENFSLNNLENAAVNIAGGIFNKTLSSMKDGVLQGIMSGINGGSNEQGLNAGYNEYYYGDYITSLNMHGYCTFTDNYTSGAKTSSEFNSDAFSKTRLRGLQIDYKNEDSLEQIADPKLEHSVSWEQTLHLPNWGYDTFINERAIFQKGLTSPFGEPGYFYFKIFFKFDTQFGLLGGILNDEDEVYGGHNTAMKYLAYLYGGGAGFYKSLLPKDRMVALRKFVKSLSYINCNAPWFFKSIKGLDKAGNPIINEFSKERSIEIECNVDAIDMRLSTLLDLYRFVVYDDYSNKEIIPENLRKFDISVLIFNTPIKTLHTAVNNAKYKQVAPHRNEYDNLMSYKLFEFNGCEIDIDSIGSMIPGDVSNETPFNIGKGIIKLNYDRCSVYTSNETNGILFGSTGFYYDYDNLNIEVASNANASTEKSSVGDQLANSLKNTFRGAKEYFSGAKPSDDVLHNSLGNSRKPDQTRTAEYLAKYDAFKTFTDVAESYTKNNLVRLSGYSLGNLYGEDNAPSYPPDGSIVSGTITPYFKSKIAHLHNRKNPILQMGGSLLASMLSSSLDPYASLGYLEGYKERGPGSEWWKNKMDRLTSNYDHIWTTTPHSHKYRIAGHEVGQRNYNKSAYVQNQELQDSLASVDQSNSISSYALRDRLKQSMQDLKKRADRGEFVGPGSVAFSQKTNMMKQGSHASTEVPHSHTGSSEKYVQQLKENTVSGSTNTLSKSDHNFTKSPYNSTEQSSKNYIQRLRENMIAGETNLLSKPSHQFTTEPHKHSTSKENYVDRLKSDNK